MSGAAHSEARAMIVAIDGPAGSGKSSTAREVARRLGFRHLDSGALYRTLALGLLRSGFDDASENSPDPGMLAEVDLAIEPEGDGYRILLDGVDAGGAIRAARITRLAAQIARTPAVRERLLPLQRAAVDHGGLVADGRDMGTVVFPDAGVKVFLTASLDERARRRLLQEGRDAMDVEITEEAGRIGERDRSDETRSVAPLRQAPGALLLDTTELAFEDQVDRIVEAVHRMELTGELSKPGEAPPGSVPPLDPSGLTWGDVPE